LWVESYDGWILRPAEVETRATAMREASRTVAHARAALNIDRDKERRKVRGAKGYVKRGGDERKKNGKSDGNK